MGCCTSRPPETLAAEIYPTPTPDAKIPKPDPKPKAQPTPQRQPEPQPKPKERPKQAAKPSHPIHAAIAVQVDLAQEEVKYEPPQPQKESPKRPSKAEVAKEIEELDILLDNDDTKPPDMLDVDYYSPKSRLSIRKQERRRSEIRAQMKKYRKQMLDAPKMTDVPDEDELYSNNTGEPALELFKSLFELDSVWTGVAEWESDGTSLGLEFTVTKPPDEKGYMDVSRLYHVARGRSRAVEGIRIYEEVIMIDRVHADQIVFEYKEETPDGLELRLICKGRQEHNEIHLKRTYVKGVAKKRSAEDVDAVWEYGSFDFVRTYFKQAGRIIKQNSLDFDDMSREDSTARITQRMSRYSEQFIYEIETGRSSGLPDMNSIPKNLTSRSIPPKGLLSPQEIEEAQLEGNSDSDTF